MTALYKIANDFAKLSDSGMNPELIADTLDSIKWELEAKIEQIIGICKNEIAYADALKNESSSLAARAMAVECRIASMKNYIANSMNTAGKKSLTAGIHQVTLREPSKVVEITDVNAIPVEFVDYETTIKPDKLAIKKQIESGVDIPGVKIKTGKITLLIK